MKKRLSFFAILLLFCEMVLAQHPHSRGESPLYWALVGGISAILLFAFYWSASFVLSLFMRNRQRSDENIVDSRSEEINTIESGIDAPSTNNEKNTTPPDESMKTNVCDNTPIQDISLTRKKRNVIIISLIMIVSSVLVVELYISNKRDRLFSDMLEQVRNSFNNINEYSPNAEDLFSENIDDLEYTEIPIPAFPNEGDKREKKHWMNMFGGIEHLYKIIDGGWTMEGEIYYPVLYKDGNYRNGIQEYRYIPYMVCVPEGADFNIHIAKTIVNKALDKVYIEPTESEAVCDALSRPNEYYEMVGHFSENSVPGISIPFYIQSTGTKPIFDNGEFTGYYWFGMQTIGQYRVLLAYRNLLAWNVVEKGGFSASAKDRVLLYGIAFALILFIIALYIYKDRIMFKSKRIVRVDKTSKQMYCRHCSKLIDADSDFCRHCGKKL